MKYIVNLSGGMTSAWALKRTIDTHGKENTEVYFADTRGKKDKDNPHAGEDTDSYRFISDLSRLFEIPIWRVADGRNIWDVMKDKRAIKIPRQDYAPCSATLKRDVLDRVIAKYAPHEITKVFGMQWYETHRMQLLININDCVCWFPLAEAPFIEKDEIRDWFIANGVNPPRLYDLGFEHNNCGGFCVRAGKAHFARLWATMPERYLYHEQKEQELCEYLGKKVTVLRDKKGGVTRKLSLREFRAELENGTAKYQIDEVGGCGCFTGNPTDTETLGGKA